MTVYCQFKKGLTSQLDCGYINSSTYHSAYFQVSLQGKEIYRLKQNRPANEKDRELKPNSTTLTYALLL
jgi:hypothetical protein